MLGGKNVETTVTATMKLRHTADSAVLVGGPNQRHLKTPETEQKKMNSTWTL